MRLINKKLIAVMLCASLLSGAVFSAGGALLSPAFEHIEKQISLKKCSINGEKVSFDATDFDGVFCSDVDFIKIEELPASAHGYLAMGSLKLGENQIVEREDFDKIVFYPAENIFDDVSFVFSNATSGEAQVSARCVVHFLDEENRNPVAENMTFSTYENVAVFKFLKAEDPDEDALSFEVVSYPEHGTLRVSDGGKGYFSYTPVKGYSGEDGFEYAARDSYGNRSKTAKVSVTVSEKDNDISFDDLAGHWAYNSAIKTASMGLMTGVSGEDGFNFRPSDTVTRGDFLAMALICAGKESEIEFVTQTSFADDADIPMNIKSYAEYARKCGIVTGYEGKNGEVIFDSNSAITRAQAAVMLERILKPKAGGSDINVFADSAAVPLWAQSAISKLTECGIISGTGFGELMPDSLVTRAQTAEMLCNVRTFVQK